MRKIKPFLFVISLFLTSGFLFGQKDVSFEDKGIDPVKSTTPTYFNSKSSVSFKDGIPGGGLLLIPESSNDRVMAFDPISGALLNADFIPSDDITLSTPLCAILSSDQNTILVSDQLKDVVYEFDFDGNLIGTFAPTGGVNTSILNNIRGISLKPNGNLLVTTGNAPNIDCVAEFDPSGNYLGNFIEDVEGGLDSPFDILYRPDFDDYLVAAYTSDAIHRYDASGTYLGDFASELNSVEQLNFSLDGNILCAGYSDDGVFEFLNDGTLVGFYPGVNGIRGVYELPDRTMIVTNGLGIHKFTREEGIIETIVGGVSARFINFAEPVFSECEHTLSLYDDVGDGWNNGSLDVMVDGTIMHQGITLESGYGPQDFVLQVATNCEVEFIYTAGNKPNENFYKVFNHIGDIVFEDGINGNEPMGGSYTADCDATPMGQIIGQVSNSGNIPIEGVRISAGDQVTFSMDDGSYTLDVATGTFDLSATLPGFITQTVPGIQVNQNDIITIDFSMEVVSPYTIPFEEQWNFTTFDKQLWGFSPERGNWEISTSDDYCNPAPGARFNWSPKANDYSYTLLSYNIDASQHTENVALQFDVHLNNYSTATLEGLEIIVEVGSDLHSLATIDNQKGSFPFTSKFFNISEIAAGDVIRVGFRAFGEDSFNINGWGLDNIIVVKPVTISGFITKISNGLPIQDAEVKIGNYESIFTDEEGTYSLDLAPGTYDVTITKTGYNQLKQTGVEIQEDISLDFQMTIPTFDLDKNAIVEVLEVGTTGIQELTITNNGNGPIEWYATTISAPVDATSVPAFEGIMNYGKNPLSAGKINKLNPKPTSSGSTDIVPGSLAFGFEIFPGHDLISLKTDDPETYIQQIPVSRDIFAADFDNDGNCYAIDNTSAELFLVDINTGTFTLIGPSIAATDLAYDKLGNVMYATYFSDPATELYRIDLTTGAANLIGNTGDGLIISLACDGNGTLWGFNVSDDNLYRINKTNGEKFLIGQVGFDGNFAQSMAWDPDSDIVYMAALNNTDSQGELRIVDRQTGASTLVGIFPGGAEVTGFGFPAPFKTWVSFSPACGTILPDKETQTISFSFDATGFDPVSSQTVNINFNTNPWTNPLSIPVVLATGQQKVELADGWSGISTYMDANGIPLELVYHNILGGKMSIMVGKNGFYWPEQGLNTIGSWNTNEGYKVKMEGDGYILFESPAVENKIVEIDEGLSFLPVFTSEPVDAIDLFEEIINDDALGFVFDIYTGQVLWPEGGLIPPNPSPFILKDIFPGVGYLIKMNAPASIDFDMAELISNTQHTKPKHNIDNHWNPVINTGLIHLIAVQTSAFDNLQPGDFIGAFNSDGLCCGLGSIENTSNNVPLPVYADDETTSVIEGMTSGEVINYKLFRNQQELIASPHYNNTLPDHNGLFTQNGLSSIFKFDLEAAGVGVSEENTIIYPNPSKGILHIETSYNSISYLNIFNAQGNNVYKCTLQGSGVIDQTTLTPGIYFIKLKTDNRVTVHKIIIE